MPLEKEKFEKLEKRKVYGITCLCGATLVTGIKPHVQKCWKCKREWLIRSDRVACLIGKAKQMRCKHFPNWTTDKYGVCKRKELCVTQGIECEAISPVIIPVGVLR